MGDFSWQKILRQATSILHEACGKAEASLPRVELRHVPAPVYLVTRFDREEGPPNHRLLAFDGAQLLSIQSGQKYKFATVESLVRCLDHCRDRAHDRMRLFRWVVFNVLVGNSDAHLKNLSFLVTSEGVALDPLYDLLSTVVYHTRDYLPEATPWPDVALSMPTGKSTRFSEVTGDDLVAVGRQLGLKSAASHQHINELSHQIGAEAAQLMQRLLASETLSAGARRIVRLIVSLPISEMAARLRS